MIQILNFQVLINHFLEFNKSESTIIKKLIITWKEIVFTVHHLLCAHPPASNSVLDHDCVHIHRFIVMYVRHHTSPHTRALVFMFPDYDCSYFFHICISYHYNDGDDDGSKN